MFQTLSNIQICPDDSEVHAIVTPEQVTQKIAQVKTHQNQSLPSQLYQREWNGTPNLENTITVMTFNLLAEGLSSNPQLTPPFPVTKQEQPEGGFGGFNLPYPEITVSEVSRILKPDGLFIGSVPNSYHLKNRLRVLKGRLIDYDQTHLRAYNVMLLKQYLQKEFVIEELTSCRGKSAFLSISWFGRDLVWKCRKK